MGFFNLFGGDSSSSFVQTSNITQNVSPVASDNAKIQQLVAAGGVQGGVQTIGFAPTNTTIYEDKSSVNYTQPSSTGSEQATAPWLTAAENSKWYNDPKKILMYGGAALVALLALVFLTRRLTK